MKRFIFLFVVLLMDASCVFAQPVQTVLRFCPEGARYAGDKSFSDKKFGEIYKTPVESVEIEGPYPASLGKVKSDAETALKNGLLSDKGISFKAVPFLNADHNLTGFGSVQLADKRKVEFAFYGNLLVICDEKGRPWYSLFDNSTSE